jgi:hypothetical protein
MKKTITLLLLLAGVSQISNADTSRISVSSFTLTNESSCIQARYLVGVNVGGASGVGSTIKIFNSTFTVTSVPQVSSISLNTVMSYQYSDTSVKGICYTTLLNVAGVTIIYAK